MIKITGLWPRKSGDGWSGRCGNTRVLMLPVDKARSRSPGRAPDYELLLAPVDDTRPLTPLPVAEAAGVERDMASDRPQGPVERPSTVSEPPPTRQQFEPAQRALTAQQSPIQRKHAVLRRASCVAGRRRGRAMDTARGGSGQPPCPFWTTAMSVRLQAPLDDEAPF